MQVEGQPFFPLSYPIIFAVKAMHVEVCTALPGPSFSSTPNMSSWHGEFHAAAECQIRRKQTVYQEAVVVAVLVVVLAVVAVPAVLAHLRLRSGS